MTFYCKSIAAEFKSSRRPENERMLRGMFSDYDSFDGEYESFQWDVHILIEGTLRAGIRYLDSDADSELAKIEEWMKKPTSSEYEDHLVDLHVDVLSTNAVQQRFLRNMALVALASRLTHALRAMARSAETFNPRKKRYGQKSMSEFTRLWVEYQERFGINFDAYASRIAFIEPLREERNQIVHDGSEANTIKPLDEIEDLGSDSGVLDMRFSSKYPEYVHGTGIGAEVDVSQELLDKNIKAAIELVAWLSRELRKRELAGAKNATGIH
jgi:hypothetical protein